MKIRFAVLCFGILMFLGVCIDATAYCRDLPDIPPPPPPASAQDLANLQAQVAQLQNQVLDLTEAVNQLSLAMANTREVLVSVAVASNFDAAKSILKTKFGIYDASISQILSQNMAIKSSLLAKISQSKNVRSRFRSNLRPIR